MLVTTIDTNANNHLLAGDVIVVDFGEVAPIPAPQLLTAERAARLARQSHIEAFMFGGCDFFP